MLNFHRVLLWIMLAWCVVPDVVCGEEPTTSTPSVRKNPFQRDTAPPLPIALTDWHCEACKPGEFQRAGNPQEIRPHAICSNNHHYDGWWVGGGTLFGGSAPCMHEGTWGWDYIGTLQRKQVWLKWSHGVREQGGRGAYKTDGPKVHLHE
jgi:hypothetical protein